MKNKGKSIKRIGTSMLATVLVLAVGIGFLSGRTRDVLAAEKMADESTFVKYKEALGEESSTEYGGRIWADKSVWAEDSVEIEAYGGVKYTVRKNENHETDEDFIVGFSALATSQSVVGQTQVPLDVAFIIDLSGSMSNTKSNMDNGKSRIYNTVQALNQSIESLMEINPYTRVSVVGFSSDAQVILPLDHYSKLQNQDFFSLNRQTGSNSTTTLSFRAKGDTEGSIKSSVEVSGGTNIQRGFYLGMKQLASATSTTVLQDGKEIKRIPSVVFLGDGSPTYSSSSNSWWAPGTGRQGDGSNPYYGNGFKAIMTASWMKAEIDQRYGVKGTNMATKVYTIGMGIDNISSENELALAKISLNPKEHWDANNDMSKNIKNAWDTYSTDSGKPTVTVNKSETYTASHPTGNLTITDKDFCEDYPVYDYVNEYYSANDANSVNQVFKNIVEHIALSVPEIPTEHDPENPTASGYITYTDPIGDYMEVKNFKSIIYGGVQYTARTVSTEGNVTTYVFTETAEGNEVYGSKELSHILIKVTSTKEGETAHKKDIVSQVLTIQIPASLIPLRVNAVTVNADGSVKNHTSNGAYPIRILYTVGLQDAVQKDGNIICEEISKAYLKKHLNTDGTVDFYSNLYTGTNEVDGNTVGNATLEFQAAPKNAFYYIQEDQYLYTDEACTKYASAEELNADTKYYYKKSHYEGLVLVDDVIAHTGAQITKNTEVTRENLGNGTYRWYYPAGMARTNTLSGLMEAKRTNLTDTAMLSYAPIYEKETGIFKIYLGNNGKLNVKAMGALEISKEVTAKEGLKAPEAVFTFQVGFEDAKGGTLSGQYPYSVLDQEGKPISEGTISSGETLQLKDGQTAKIAYLPAETIYTISEINIPEGFSVKEANKETQTGVVYGGRTVSHVFENEYAVAPVVYAGTTGIVGTKILEGRNWSAKDSFTFMLEATDLAPLPEGYDKQQGITVIGTGNKNANIVFGEDVDQDGDRGIEFTKPGVYEYFIYEKQPDANESMPGMSYSGARYVLTVTVVDNGKGDLEATSSVQKLYLDDGTPLFTYDAQQNRVMRAGEEAEDDIVFKNIYQAKSVAKVLTAQKEYQDTSREKPLTSGMFAFKLEPAGVVENNSLKIGTANLNPMPLDASGNRLNQVIVENEGESIVFLPITYTEACIPATQDTIVYRYTMREVMPDTANESNQYTVNGMKYDSKVAIVDVRVTRSEESDTLIVETFYPNNENGVVFQNAYTPSQVSVELVGEKTLIGRDMKEDESFIFTITGADVEAKEVRVTGGKDGETKEFSFGEYTFTKSGTYVFDIRENPGEEGGVTYDEHVCEVTVLVTDVNGKLEADVTYSDGECASFENVYEAKFDPSTAIRLSGLKRLLGRAIEKGEFFFAVTDTSGETTYISVPENAQCVLGICESSLVLLDGQTYDKPGTYTYEIQEVIPTNAQNATLNGVEYDVSRYVVEVTVIDDLKGNIKASISKVVKKNGEATETVEAFDGTIVFENRYKTASKEYVVGALEKVLTGNRKDPLRENEFQFERTIAQAEHEDGIQLYKKEGYNGADIVGNELDGTIQFGNIRFTKTGVYVIEIKEVIPEDGQKVAGVTYDECVIRETYTVTDDLRGNLVVARTKIEGGTQFTNVYQAEGVLQGEGHLTVTKRVDLSKRTNVVWGIDENETFTFAIEAGDEQTASAIADGKISMGSAKLEINGDGAVSIHESGVYSNQKAFGDIVFWAAGEYTFKISEQRGYGPGIEYDETVYVLPVSATDNGDGTLNITCQEEGTEDFLFVNRYNPGEIVLKGSEHLRVNKVFTGRENHEWLSTDKFSFTIEANEEHEETKKALEEKLIQMPADEESQLSIHAENKDNASFGDITFKKAGTYQFVIREVPGNIPGVKYDEDADRILQVIVEENEVGTEAYLTVRVDYENSEVDNGAAVTFANSYQSSPSNSISILARKIVTPKTEGNQYTIEARDFGFILMPASGNKESDPVEEMTVYNDELGNVEFALAKEYLEPGEYQYVIKETVGQNGTLQGMLLDPAVYVVTVSVAHDYENACLEAMMEMKKEVDGQEEVVSEIVFNNLYDPSVTAVSISGIKKLHVDGGDRVLKSGEFTFRLEAIDSAPMPKEATNGVLEVTNVESTFSFGNIEYDVPGIYRYKVSEIADENKSYFIYDQTEYEVVITVEDVEGELKVTENSLDTTSLIFDNTYKLMPAEVVLSGMKHLEGRNLKAQEFSFLLMENGEVVKTATNQADGVFAFEKLSFDKIGTYQYVVTEDRTNEVKGITYDTSQYAIDIIVTDDGEGQLVAQVTGMDSLVFNNTYESYPGSVPTGDQTTVLPYVVGLLGSIGLLVLLVILYKKRK